MVHIPNNDSKWIFIAGSEPRFVFDILNASIIIRNRQKSSDNIYYFTDCENARNILTMNGCSAGNLYGLSNVKAEIEKFEGISSVYCVVSSHGDIDGIENIIKPNELIKTMQEINGVTDGFVLFGQCYSGIFNLSNQSKFCIMGASNFYPSISHSAITSNNWSANVFLYYFFNWIATPRDVDGDGQFSIADAFKWASYQTNRFLVNLKISDSKTFYKWCLKESKDLEKLKKKSTPQDAPDIDVREAKLNENLLIYHNQQEAWISNCDAAQRLLLKLL